jgi:hypothetical protein
MGRKATITSVKRIEREQRTAVILQMRLEGMSLREIGAAQDPPVSGVAIFKTIRKALERMASKAVEQVRKLEALRLDELQTGVYEPALKGDARAIDAVLSIMRARSRLMRLDAAPVRFAAGVEDPADRPPVRVEVDGSNLEYVRRLEQRLLALEGEPPRSVRVS